MAQIRDLTLQIIDERPRSEEAERTVTLDVFFTVATDASEQNLRWNAVIDVYGKDPTGDQSLFRMRWVEFRRSRQPGSLIQVEIVDNFNVLYGAQPQSFRKRMSGVARESLDEDPGKVVTAKTRNYGILTLLIPDVDEIFARVTLTPSDPARQPVKQDSPAVQGIYEPNLS
jgi:hypothetical protein